VPARERSLRIEDILAAVERIQRYTAGMDLAGFGVTQETLWKTAREDLAAYQAR
jgi:uncharacterized protein with HEPN domain